MGTWGLFCTLILSNEQLSAPKACGIMGRERTICRRHHTGQGAFLDALGRLIVISESVSTLNEIIMNALLLGF